MWGRAPSWESGMADCTHDNLAWRVCNGRTIFLDIAKDRYFRLPPEADQGFQAKHSETGQAMWKQPEYFPRPALWQPATSTHEAIGGGGFSLPAVAAAIWVQRRIERRLASRGFQAILLELSRARRPAKKPNPQTDQIGPVICAFEQARLLRTAADRCLPRSLAIITQLAASRIHADLVIGVRDQPFGAHCWAQHGTVILNDSLEETRRYEPILIV